MKKVKNKQAKKVSQEMKAQNAKRLTTLRHPSIAKQSSRDLPIIHVKNAEGDPDTVAEIVVQNKIDYAPKVSVIIPVYNVEQYLRECLDSVINQTLKEIEIICVDDGSTDSSLDILKEYAKKDKRITVLAQENLHAGVARNAGLAVAKGEYVHFLDSDDWVDLDTYEKLYKIVKRNKVSFAKFKSYTYDMLKKTIISSEYTDMSYIAKDMTISVDDNMKLAIKISDSPWSGIYNLEFLKSNDIKFDNFICSNDVGFYFRCLIKSRTLYFINNKCVYYRVNNQKSLVGIRPKNFDCQIKTYYRIQNIIREEKDDIIDAIQDRFSMAIFWRFKAYLEDERIDNKTKNNIRYLTTKFYQNNPDSKYKIEYDKYIAERSEEYTTKISVIIPIYNVERYLRQCLDSILNQTLKDIEIICIDDGSTDRSLDILKEYAKKDNRVFFYQQNHKRAGAARNFGVKMAQGKYIYFIDSDDWIDLDCLEKLYNKIEKEQTDICIYGIKNYDEKTHKVYEDSYKDMSCFKNRLYEICTYQDIKEQIFRRFGAYFNIYNREFFIKNDIFFQEDILIGEDVLPHVKSLVLAKSISFWNESLYYYRTNRDGSSMTSSKNDKTILDVFNYVNEVQYFLIKSKAYQYLESQYIDFALEQFLFHFKRMTNEKLKQEFIEKVKKFTEHMNVCKIEDSEYALKFQYLIGENIFSSLKAISVIIPVYNVEEYLRECLNSVINQTLKDIEIICVNDGSTDNSLTILEEYAAKDNRIKIINQKNQGLSCSRNNALKIAKGKYILFVDSDDYLNLDACEKIYNTMNLNNLDMLSYSGVNFDSKTKNFSENKYWSFSYLPENFNYHQFNWLDVKPFIHRMAVSSCLTTYRNSLIKEHKLLFPEHLCFEDNIFFIQAITQAKLCGLLKEKLYNRRIHSESITQNWNRHFSDYLKISDMVIKYVKQNQSGLYETYKNVYLSGCINIWKNFDEKDRKKYEKELKKLLKKYSFDSIYIKNSISSFTCYFLFPYYLLHLPVLRKKIFKAQIKQTLASLSPMRVDVKNFGTAENSVSVVAQNANINQPTWFANAQGQGTVVESSALSQKMTIQAHKNGNLRFDFRGADKRDTQGVRFPVWIDYKSIKIDGTEILSEPVATWHDKPYRYEMPVKDGQTVTLEVEQQPHQYTQDELKDLILKLNPNSEYIRTHLTEIAEIIAKNNKPRKGLGYFIFHKKKTAKYKKIYLFGLPIWKKKVSIYKYLDNRLAQFASTQNEQLQTITKQLQTLQSVLQNHVNTQISQIKTTVESQKKEFQDKINTQSAQMNNLESLVIGQSHVMQAKVANLADSIAEILAQNAETYQNILSTTLKNLQTTLKQSVTHNKTLILEALKNNENVLFDTLQKQEEKAKALSSLITEQNQQLQTAVRTDIYNHVRSRQIVVSLTSYPARINSVHQTVETLLKQSLKADKIILWLAVEEFPNKEADLPQQLLDLRAKGLSIEWCHDIKSYKKLIPALKKYPETIIVTADDDVLYREQWLEKLYNSYLLNPEMIHCHRAHKILMTNGIIQPYTQWVQSSKLKENEYGYSVFFTGVGGVLYPPHCLNKDIFNEELFMKLCPKNDDIWFWGMAVLNGVKIRLIDSALQHPVVIEGSQKESLYALNVLQNLNDVQIKDFLKQYPQVLKILRQENKEEDFLLASNQ